MFNKLIKILILVASLYISGCAASGPKFSQINTFPSDMSQIYIYRPWAFTAGGVGLPIIHSGEQLPHPLHNQGYINYLAQAGHHEMHVNVDGFIDRKIDFDSEPGETYFIKLTIQNYFGVIGTRLSLVEKDIALKEIKECKLSNTGNSLKSRMQESVPIMGKTAKSTQSTYQRAKESNALVAEEIRKLSELKKEGIITEEEFENRKSKLLNI